jgi:AGCS family alanine or glycine:cation symporter
MLEIISSISIFLWTYVVITMLVGCSLYFTWKLRAVQFTQIKEMVKSMFNPAFSTKENDGRQKAVSSFQAFAISLSSRVGTGNLAGVASAIFVGGPGAVFWMWIMALLGASTAFMEATLAQLFKRKGEDSFYGGPAYYMQHGLGKRWMGIIFACFIIFGFGLANQIVQSNTLCDAMNEAFAIGTDRAAWMLTVITLVIIFGGTQRIANFAATVVPFMAIGYLILAIVILGLNIQHIPAMFMLIIRSAFGMQQVVGGTLGMAVMQGVKRGLFSNEAGEGSAPNAAATATVTHPIKQGLLQSLGVFTDTLVICTCTAFIIILFMIETDISNPQADGIILTKYAMEHHLGTTGGWYLTAAIFLFAYSTIIANYFYGETNIRFISDKPWAILVFRLLSGVVVLLGGYLTLQQAWSIVDLAMALMTSLNLIAVVWLSKYVFRLLKDYQQQRREHKDPIFQKNMFPDADIEGWD